MDAMIENLRETSTLVQSLAVSAGGLIGVFVTLAFFFAMILVAGKLGKKGGD